MLRLITYSLMALLPVAACAIELPPETPINGMPAGKYELDDKHASVVWKVNHLGLSNYTARFTDIDASLNLDPNDVTKSTLLVTIDPTSIETDFPTSKETDFNKKLASGEDWFNAGKFPKITYRSKSIEKTGDKTAIIHGELSFLGVTKPLDMNVAFNGAYENMPFSNAPAMGFSARTIIDRTQWGMDHYAPAIGEKVEVVIEAEFHKAK